MFCSAFDKVLDINCLCCDSFVGCVLFIILTPADLFAQYVTINFVLFSNVHMVSNAYFGFTVMNGFFFLSLSCVIFN